MTDKLNNCRAAFEKWLGCTSQYTGRDWHAWKAGHDYGYEEGYKAVEDDIMAMKDALVTARTTLIRNGFPDLPFLDDGIQNAINTLQNPYRESVTQKEGYKVKALPPNCLRFYNWAQLRGFDPGLEADTEGYTAEEYWNHALDIIEGRKSITPKAVYKNIINFLNTWKLYPAPDSTRALNMISDFYLCIGAEPGFTISKIENGKANA